MLLVCIYKILEIMAAIMFRDFVFRDFVVSDFDFMAATFSETSGDVLGMHQQF